MTGLEVMSKLIEQGNDFDHYAENKLAEIYDVACGLIEEQERENKFTDCGHSNCISLLKSFVKNLKSDAIPNEEDPEMN